MAKEALLQNFLSGAGLLATNDTEGVHFGETLPRFVPAGLEKVMQAHTSEIDQLREKMVKGSLTEIELFLTRGFTFAEYQTLFDLGVKEKDFTQYPAFRSLWIATEAQRRKYIYHIQKENFNDYLRLLEGCFKQFNKNLLTFFFPANPSCQVSV